jgi:hypothetical protein
LRNRIYDFACETEHICLSITRRRSPQSKRRPAEVYNPPQYLALAQTCCQLRTEFLPIYRTKTVHSLCPTEVANFIATIIFDKGPEKAVGNILIDLSMKWGDDDEHLRVDFLPLVYFLRIRFRTTKQTSDGEDALARELEQYLPFAPGPELNPSVNGATESKWAVYIRNSIEEIIVKPHAWRDPVSLFSTPLCIKIRHWDDLALLYGEKRRRCRIRMDMTGWVAAQESWERSMGLWMPALRRIIQVRLPDADGTEATLRAVVTSGHSLPGRFQLNLVDSLRHQRSAIALPSFRHWCPSQGSLRRESCAL